MRRRPPRSTPFPTRRSSDLGAPGHEAQRPCPRPRVHGTSGGVKAIIIGAGRGSRLRHLTNEIPKTLVPIRSEEHTSELQSRRDLVCRLLLEKKNNYQSQNRV